MRCGRAVRRARGCASRASDRRKSGHWLVANAQCLTNGQVRQLVERHGWKLVARDNGAIGWSGTIHLADRTHPTHWAWLYALSRSREEACRVVSEDTFPKRASACCLPAHHPQHRLTTCPSSKPTTPGRHARVRLEETPKLEEHHYPRVAPGGARVIMTRGVSLNRTTPHLESLRLS